jgi:biotin carboxyl carrier protein
MLFYVQYKGQERKVRVESRENQIFVSWEDEPESKVDLTFLGNDCHFIHGNHVFHANIVGEKNDYTVWTPSAAMSLSVESEYRRIVGKLRKQDIGQENNVYAKMPGKIVKVGITAGAIVEKGSPLLVMEAMKMENEIRSAIAGKVEKILVSEGQAVETGALLIEISPSED